MSTELYLIYLATIIVLLATPGPMTLVTLSTSIRHGHSQALFTILASNAAGIVLMLLSAMGVGAMIANNTVLFEGLKYCGAAYLIWMGISSWRAQLVDPNQVTVTAEAGCIRGRTLFSKTLLLGLSNPKGLIFFAALFPQFIEMEGSLNVQQQLLLLCITFTLVDFLILNLVAMGGSNLAYKLNHPKAQLGFNRTCGAMFLCLGAFLLL